VKRKGRRQEFSRQRPLFPPPRTPGGPLWRT
jgi:hypothetical protein